ncbi:glutamate-5-semialdehyde dehydrogenase [Helicobacter sp. MIT 99-5507]|uniref:glutamate-5-semialdehyde dehydrogenase n=1 Tax=Helicobacter sp. MIT 99-5507 TaxID=152489 RepID=UPI000E1F2A53|nr:glutamate-5-semialdehyde dehydrogenase [Helicobacter sp. MIT 99-5507]RDU56652.1 glutamate-5-semialdehyde dehydrogenase [Helicobacter sp. MIT 99-5507]
MKNILENARNAKQIVANLPDILRNEILNAMADNIIKMKHKILEANKLDIQNAANLSNSMIERLKLDSKKIDDIADSIRVIAKLKSPLGKVIDGFENYAGLKIRKISVPIGVIAVIYESRPNVTSDVGALCFKSGNVCILKGGKEALESNKTILEALHDTLIQYNLPTSIIGFIDSRDSIELLLKEDKYIDLVIPRGGEGLISFVSLHSKIPVIKHDKGVCAMYIDKTCNQKKAIEIAINAKTSKPSACNSIETILIHKDSDMLYDLITSLKNNNITIKAQDCIANKFNLAHLNDNDFYEEYGDNTLNLKIVDNIDEAIKHIKTYGSFHSDCIITDDYAMAEKFLDEVDSACVYVNASTRFSDGGEFGFGAEVGISTSKIHARGPMGIDSLTTYKYQIYGDGQIRK